MNNIPLRLKLKVARRGILQVLRQPSYVLLAAFISVIFYEIIFWFNNLALLQYMVTAPSLSSGAKLEFLASTYTSIWQSTASPLAVGLIILSLLQGIVLSSIVYMVVRQKQTNDSGKVVASSGIASVFATLGLGCAACGTSLITPILAFMFSSTSVALADSVGFIVVLMGLIVGLYALYSAGTKVSAVSLRSDRLRDPVTHSV